MRWITVVSALAMLAACTQKPDYPKASGEPISVKMSSLKGSEPLFMSLVNNETRIDFFVINGSGTVESYFDACMKCYPKKMGYRPQKGRLSCKACDVTYPYEALKGIGSCYPIELKGRLEAGSYVIERGDVIGGEKYFR